MQLELEITEVRKIMAPIEFPDKDDPEVTVVRRVMRGIKVIFNDGHYVNICQRTDGLGRTVDTFSVWIVQKKRRKAGVYEEKKCVFPAATWEKFERAYGHCDMPGLIMDAARSGVMCG